MEHISVRHAVRVGMRCRARVANVAASFVSLELDLTSVAPGRSPFLDAGLQFDRTLFPERAHLLQTGESIVVGLIDVAEADPYDWVQASLPPDPAWLAWNGGTVPGIARRVIATGETVLLPVLADALEEAGCTDATLLGYCRASKPDAAQSWMIELLAADG